MPEQSAYPDHCRIRLEPERHDALHEDLDAWRANVGSPIAIDAGPVAPPRLTGIDVLCWNIAIGQGRLDAVLDRLRTDAHAPVGSSPARPLVILVQEAYREDESVPGAAGSLHHGGRLAERRRADIVALAERSDLSLRYSPSMRNGVHGSDRGNAVLSSVRLADAHAFLLPYVRQRRVAVTAQLAGHPDLTFVSAHLDTHGRDRDTGSARIGAGRSAQARALAHALDDVAGSVVLGADLNSLFGMTDPAVRVLVEAGMHPARRIGSWTHTFHRRLRLLLDHVFFRSPDHRIARVGVTRLDEVDDDRSKHVFGSDHHPLLARIDLDAR
jgi:endonuclease/exonuclease/phosphatase family metal-dependent hydrolase